LDTRDFLLVININYGSISYHVEISVLKIANFSYSRAFNAPLRVLPWEFPNAV